MPERPLAAAFGDRRTAKAALVVGSLFVAVAAVLAAGRPARGYEISMYAATPTAAWILLVVGSALYFSILLFFRVRRLPVMYWTIAWTGLLLVVTVVVSLPLIRGYFQYGGTDQVHHIRMVQSLVATGQLSTHNFYPATHTFVAVLSFVLGVDPTVLAKVVPVLFTLLFAGFGYVFASELFDDHSRVAFVSVLYLLLPFNSLQVQLYPESVSVIFSIVVLYLALVHMREGATHPGYRVLLSLTALFLAFTHPANAAVLAATTMVTGGCWYVATRLTRVGASRRVRAFVGGWWTAGLILGITLFIWLSKFRAFRVNVSAIVGRTVQVLASALPTWLVGDGWTVPGATSSNVQSVSGPLSRLSIVEVVQYIWRMYGDSIFVGGFAAIAVLLIAYSYWSRCDPEWTERSRLATLCLVFILAICADAAFYLVVGRQTIGRLLNLPLFAVVAPLLAGSVLLRLVQRFPHERIGNALIVGVLFLLFWSSVLSVYHSPWIYSMGWHLTHGDASGAEWFQEHRVEGVSAEAISLGGNLVSPEQSGLFPPHFGYDEVARAGDAVVGCPYLVIDNRLRAALAHPMVMEARLNMDRWEFTESDFDELSIDSSVNKVYTNSELDVFKVAGPCAT